LPQVDQGRRFRKAGPGLEMNADAEHMQERGPGIGPRLDSSRLLELRAKYEAFDDPRTAHALWTDSYVADDLDLGAFRDDNVFLWQGRDGNVASSYLLTAYYYLSIGRSGLLEHMQEDGAFGAQTTMINDERLLSRDLLDSVGEIAFLDDILGISRWPQVRVLDIGAGYGRLAHRLIEAFPDTTSVATVDAVAESTFLSEFYLAYRGVDDRSTVLELPSLDLWLGSEQVDVAVNVHSFSECSFTVVRCWLDTIAESSIKFLMVVPNRGTHGGTRLLSRETDGTNTDYLPELERRGFELVARRPKYLHSSVQEYGVSPTYHWLFARE